MTWLLYGAYGYTGELIAREAARRGLRPVLAGRNEQKVRAIADELQLEYRAFALNEPSAIAKHLDGCSTVLNCAGPFSQTAQPMMEACLAANTHYLDITGEMDVIEAAAALDERAKDAHVILMPAVGFDVVPTDCLAAMLKERLPEATHLQLALAGLTQVSRGTARTMAEMIPSGGRVREDGKIVRVPLAHKSQSVPFADRRRQTVTMPWGDVASAYYSTGIGNIEVYFALPKRQIKWLKRLRGVMPMLGVWPFSSVARWFIPDGGPSAEARDEERAQLWGKVLHDNASAETTLVTPNGYALTVDTALAAVERLESSTDLSHNEGFQTPSKAFGSDFILQFDVELQWRDHE